MSASILKSITLPVKLSFASKEIVIAVQQQLNLLGYQLTVDGIPGVYTMSAFNSFKASHHLGEPGILGVSSAAKLIESATAILITSPQALAIFGRMPTREQMVDLNRCLLQFEINTPARLRHFMSQITVESGGLKWMKELASGDAYEGRRDLGNLFPGDGRRFRGSGCIQLTGRANYQALSDYLKDTRVMEGCDYVAAHLPFTASGHWWFRNNMNSLCDRDATVEQVTKRVNGGYNHLSERKRYYAIACKVILG